MSSARGLRLLKSLELLKTMSTFDAAVINKMKLQSADNGNLKCTFTIDSSMCNIGKTLHGGYITSIVDVLSFYSQMSHPNGRVSWTTSINVVYLAPAKLGEIVNVEVKLLQVGNMTSVETYFSNDTGKLLAKSVATFLAGGEKYQEKFKDVLKFDVHEQ